MGLKYQKGKFETVLEDGQYWYMPLFTIIEKVDVRPRSVSIPGQKVLSSDGVTLKVSIAANFEVIDPNVAMNKVTSFQKTLYLKLQLASREIIGSADIYTVLNSRNEMSNRLMDLTEPKAGALGLKLISAI